MVRGKKEEKNRYQNESEFLVENDTGKEPGGCRVFTGHSGVGQDRIPTKRAVTLSDSFIQTGDRRCDTL